MSGNLCKAHNPVQHRDGKPPWCNECGLTSGYQEPKSRFDKENKVADNTGIPFSSLDEGMNYPEIAKEIVFRYVAVELHELRRHGTFSKDEVYVVWFAKTLKNWKALVSTSLPDGRYYEITFNGEKNVAYLDMYIKAKNMEVSFDDITLIANGRPFRKIRSPYGFEPNDDPI